MSVSDERQRACLNLIRVESGAFAARLLGKSSHRGVRTRVLGVLRWQRLLDVVLEGRLSRPLAKLDSEVRNVLRLGLFEASLLDIPRAVATDQAVRLTSRLGKKSAAGMVNAVLRRATGDWSKYLETAPPDVAYSHPEWLYDRWCANFGHTEAEHSMQSNQKPAPLCFWFASEAYQAEALSNFEITPHPWCTGAWTTENDAPGIIAMIKDHKAYAQDASSQLVARLAARLAGPSPRVADLCAAPGGKTALLSTLTSPSILVAADLRPMRAQLVKGLVSRFGPATVLVADATAPPLQESSWDIVLLDAPCSGTGTLRRHPELRWRLKESSISELSLLQSKLLEAASKLVVQGGLLLYSTCSIEPEENEALINETNLEFEDLKAVMPDNAEWRPTEAGGARILPNDDADGFTIHALRRR